MLQVNKQFLPHITLFHMQRKYISYTLLLLFLALGNISYAQRFKAEQYIYTSLGMGFNTLARPKNPLNNEHGMGFNLSASAAYKINYYWGIKVDYGFHTFKALDRPVVKGMQIGVSGIADLLQFGTEGYLEALGEFSLLAYSGLGLMSAWEKRRLSADAKYIRGNDDMLYYNIGLIPRYRIGLDLTVNCDIGYNFVFFHDKYFDGTGTMPKKTAGSFMAISFGVTYEFRQ